MIEATAPSTEGLAVRRLALRLIRRMPAWATGALATLPAIVALGVALQPFRASVRYANLSLGYIVIVLVASVVWGLGAGLATSLVAAAWLWVFSLRPFSAGVSTPGELDILALVAFLLAAIVTGQLSAQLRVRTIEAERGRREADFLTELGATLLASRGAGVGPLETIRRIFAAQRAALDPPLATGEISPAEREPAADGPIPTVTAVVPGEPRRVLRLWGGMEKMAERGVLTDTVLRGTAQLLALELERERLERDAAEAESLRRSEEFRTALLSQVSHDLRTPLVSIRANAELLATDETDAASRGELANAISQQADRLNRMVGSMLSMSRIESGALRPDCDWQDPADLIASVVPAGGGLGAQHRIEPAIDPALPLVWCDFGLMRQLLGNLVENAVFYSPPGTTVRIEARHAEHAAIFSVADQGPGISADEQERIFERFYRGSTARQARPEGAGLGLSIVKAIADAHGATVQVESSIGEGTLFRIRLPQPELPAIPEEME